MFWSRFLDNGSTNSKTVYTFLTPRFKGFISSSCNLLDICAPSPRKWGSSGFTVVYASMRYMNSRCRIVVAVNSLMRVDARSCMNVLGQAIASIIDDSRCGMSDVAFCIPPPIGGLSC